MLERFSKGRWLTASEEMKLRGISKKVLESERPMSWESFRIMAAHNEKATAYWRWQRLRQNLEYTLTPEVENNLEIAVATVTVKEAQIEYSFTDAQMKIAMSAHERRTKKWQ